MKRKHASNSRIGITLTLEYIHNLAGDDLDFFLQLPVASALITL